VALLMVCLGVPGAARFLYAQAPADSTRAARADSAAASPAGAASAVVPVRDFKMHLSAYPYAYYTPETEFAFGAGGIVTFYTGKDLTLRPSKATLSAYYTTKDQYKVSLSPEIYLNKNTLFASLKLDYGRYVDKFYGVGNSTPKIDNADYVMKGGGIRAEFQVPPLFPLLTATRVGIIYDFSQRDITDDLGNPNLQDSTLTGVSAGSISGVGFTWVWDNRDQIFYPHSGGYNKVSGIFYMSDLGSDYDYNRYELDIRHYFGKANRRVLAVQVFAQATFGEPPFYQLPALGGQRIMRGYYEGRYRDRQYTATQVEYRLHLGGRFGAVAFVGTGDVADKVKDLKIRDFKISAGAGLRVLFNQAENVNLRVDMGFGNDTNGVYFGLEEAF
jgi:outer membrane protein assembly factor BamA